MSIASQISYINESLKNSSAKLIAVSKNKTNNLIEEAYLSGQRAFGENKVQELVDKEAVLPKDIEWHMIGHLQRNKVKYIAPFVHLIHGVDTVKLIKEINKEGAKNNRVIHCLIQIYIAKEESKFGFSEAEIMGFLKSSELEYLTNVRIVGLMGMATNTADTDQISSEFRSLKVLFDELKSKFATNQVQFNELSMGMSGDYKLAITQGSTMVRIGSSIFGARNRSV